ncbi:uncharacterized protein LOC105170822 [Sesamum indicum]|uniref:Uncharacterized protein LOC105170822 n=1 Tax=Sesamum indicum TaxID=4182 RepID=A0A6I9U821_SESIN|nr:uncharacterized protein LOC105170822 [Sesamum indicum]
MAHFLIVAILTFLSVTRAEDRAHGLENQSPAVLPPEAYTFFNPKTQQSKNSQCISSDCSLLPLAATLQSTARKSASPSGRGLGAGGIAGISLGFVFACLITAGVYYVVIKQQANKRIESPQQLAEV